MILNKCSHTNGKGNNPVWFIDADKFQFKQIGDVATPYINSATYQPVNNGKGDFRITIDAVYIWTALLIWTAIKNTCFCILKGIRHNY